MPNWMEGTLHLRGKVKDIQKFITEGIEKNGAYSEYITKKAFTDYSQPGTLEFSFEWEPWVIDTNRAFVQDCTVYTSYESDDDERSVSMPIQQAWCFRIDDWLDLCKKYDIDIKLNGIECGMLFCQEIIILRGESEPTIAKDESIKYDDWEWECPFPNMGG